MDNIYIRDNAKPKKLARVTSYIYIVKTSKGHFIHIHCEKSKSHFIHIHWENQQGSLHTYTLGKLARVQKTCKNNIIKSFHKRCLKVLYNEKSSPNEELLLSDGFHSLQKYTSYKELKPVGIYLLKVNNRSTRTRCEICSKLNNKDTKTTPLASNIFHILFQCFFC